jgi:hypothetical protein
MISVWPYPNDKTELQQKELLRIAVSLGCSVQQKTSERIHVVFPQVVMHLIVELVLEPQTEY